MTPSQIELELEALRTKLAALEARPQTRSPSRGSVWLAAGVVVLALGTWSERAFSAACASGLICFSAGTPAKADDINGNFDTLKKWIETKVGALPAGVPGAASSSDITVSSATVNGATLLKGTMKYDCPACGSTSTLEGNLDYGDLTIQGRVLSGSNNIHLSPPGGSGVFINDDYRAAGGVSGANAAGGAFLSVEGPASAYRFTPQYETSGWFSVTTNQNYTVAHGLGVVPSFVMLQTCGAINGSNVCTTRVNLSGPSGFNDGNSCLSPITTSADTNNIYISTSNCATHGYYTANSGFVSQASSYYRVLIYR